ncbi:hypothetical protein Trydic_g12691 [Trypoxylus dichotomus]
MIMVQLYNSRALYVQHQENYSKIKKLAFGQITRAQLLGRIRDIYGSVRILLMLEILLRAAVLNHLASRRLPLAAHTNGNRKSQGMLMIAVPSTPLRRVPSNRPRSRNG